MLQDNTASTDTERVDNLTPRGLNRVGIKVGFGLLLSLLVIASMFSFLMEANSFSMVLVVVLIGLACGTLAAVAITTAITGPVGKLVSASQAIARGDLSQRVNIQSKDEFGILGEAFNEMVDHRQRAQENLEARADGVAHDFNNLLTAIMGYSQMSLREAPVEGPLTNHLQEIQQATERAAVLTDQLLAFSRHQVIEAEVIDLNDKVYLPVTEKTYAAQRRIVNSSISPQGKETVLLAEDEPLLRSMVATVLRGRGYEVLETANGEEALGMVQKHGGEGIELLLTDVVMPQMGGLELAKKLHATNPNIKVLFTSGYAGDSLFELDALPTGTEFLPKPYMPETLAVKVREVLNQRTASLR